MTTSEILACAISGVSAVVAVAAWIGTRRQAARNRRERECTFPVYDGGGVITFSDRMSDAEVEEFKARWRETYGKPGTAHPVEPLDEEGSGA